MLYACLIFGLSRVYVMCLYRVMYIMSTGLIGFVMGSGLSYVLTHYNTFLDLFFVSDVNNICLYDQLIVSSFSKHGLIYLTYNLDLNYTDHTIVYSDFKNINYILLYETFDQCV